MTTDARPTFLDRQRDAALTEIRERQAEFGRIADIVIPKRNDVLHRGTRRVNDIITIGADHLVEVTDRNDTYWTTVVADKPSHHYFHTQDEALLHLIARRHDSDDSKTSGAAFYAGRVLGIPASDD